MSGLSMCSNYLENADLFASPWVPVTLSGNRQVMQRIAQLGEVLVGIDNTTGANHTPRRLPLTPGELLTLYSSGAIGRGRAE